MTLPHSLAFFLSVWGQFVFAASEYGVVNLNTYLLKDLSGISLKADLSARAKIIPQRLAQDSRVRLALVQEVWTPELRSEMAVAMAKKGFFFAASQNSVSSVTIANGCGALLGAAYVTTMVGNGTKPHAFSRRTFLRTVRLPALLSTTSILGFAIDERWRKMGNGLVIFSKDPIRKVSHASFGWAIAEEDEVFCRQGNHHGRNRSGSRNRREGLHDPSPGAALFIQ